MILLFLSFSLCCFSLRGNGNSVTIWLGCFFNIWQFTTLKIAQKRRMFTKVGTLMIWSKSQLIPSFYFNQSGKFSPNLVTLNGMESTYFIFLEKSSDRIKRFKNKTCLLRASFNGTECLKEYSFSLHWIVLHFVVVFTVKVVLNG